MTPPPKPRNLGVPPKYFSLHLRVLAIFGVALEPMRTPFLQYLQNFYSFAVLNTQLFLSMLELVDVTSLFPDVVTMSFGLCYLMSRLLGSVKSVLLIAQRKKLWAQFLKLQSGVFKPDFERGGAEEFELINSALNIGKYQGIFFYVFAIFIVGLRGLATAVGHGIDEEVFDEQLNATVLVHRRVLPYNMYIPFDCQKSPLFEIVFIGQLIWTVSYGIGIGAADALIYGFMIVLKAQFLILKMALKSIIERAEREIIRDHGKLEKTQDNNLKLLEGIDPAPSFPPKTLEYAEKLAIKCVDHHQQLIALCDETEEVFCYLMLLQFLSSLLILCLSLFQLSMNPGNFFNIVSMSMYLTLMVYQVLVYCWHGNEIQRVSENIASNTYHANWIGTNKTIQKSLLMMAIRSQRPCRFTAGKFAFLSIQTFMSIVRGSASYFMVLQQMT